MDDGTRRRVLVGSGMMTESHRTRAGYQMTARMRLPDGTPLVLSAEGPDQEEVQARLLAKIDAYFDDEEKEPAE